MSADPVLSGQGLGGSRGLERSAGEGDGEEDDQDGGEGFAARVGEKTA